jgi:hypothetical protein
MRHGSKIARMSKRLRLFAYPMNVAEHTSGVIGDLPDGLECYGRLDPRGSVHRNNQVNLCGGNRPHE